MYAQHGIRSLFVSWGRDCLSYRQQVEFLFGDDFKVVIQSLEIIIADLVEHLLVVFFKNARFISRDDSRIELIQKHYVGFELCVN